MGVIGKNKWVNFLHIYLIFDTMISFIEGNELRIFYLCLGFLVFSLAVLGIFLPVLPTTPLVLLSTFFFGKSSPRFHRWVTNTWVYEKYAKDFMEHRSMTLGRKIFLLSLVSIMLLFPLILLAPLWKLVIVGIYIFLYYYFICKIKTVPAQKNEE